MSSQVVESQSGKQGQGGAGMLRTAPTRGSRSQLVQRLMSANDSLPAFLNDLLTTQAVSVVGTEAAAFVIERQGAVEKLGPDKTSAAPFNLRPIAHMRPDDSDDAVRQQALQAFMDLIIPCVQQDKDGAVEIAAAEEPGGEAQFCLITLLRSEGNAVAVSAVITRCGDNERARQRLMSMQLVAGYFELYGLRRSTDQSKQTITRQTRALQLVNSVATADGFQAAANGLCNELAQRTGASRVSIGWLKSESIKLKALSHTEKFDKKQELVVTLERVMEECLDQEQVVQYQSNGGPSTPNVTREAQALSRANGGNSVVSLPLRRKAETIGILTLEFDSSHKLDEEHATALQVAADLVAPSLWDRFQNDRWLITKAGLSAKNVGAATIGPKYMITKLVITIIVGSLVFISLYSTMYKVSAPFKFSATTKRELAAPVEGRIEEVFKLPGDQVKAGDKLVQLDVKDLVQKKFEAASEAAIAAQSAQAYRDEGKLSQELQEREKERAARNKVKFLEDQIARHTIVAPFDGRVLSGDLKDKKGSPVKMGDLLLSVGQTSGLEAEIDVAERDIQEVREGMSGYLATTSLPGETYPFTVTRIVPIGQSGGGGNVFKVYATLPTQAHTWSPGLPGEARIEIEPRTLLRQWTGRAIDWIRLNFWL